jgi:hypothetical protein
MANIEHVVITDPNIHEPKGVSSAQISTVYKANGTGSGTWSRLTETDLAYSDKTKNIFGWNDIADSLYTSGSPRAISSGVRTQLTNNAAAAQTDTSRLGSLWSTSLNRFDINDINAFYVLRVNCKVTAAAAAGTPYISLFELQSANGPTVILGQTAFIKGGGNVNQMSITLPFYTGSFINNQALTLFVTPDTNINIYDIGFVIQRTYKES